MEVFSPDSSSSQQDAKKSGAPPLTTAPESSASDQASAQGDTNMADGPSEASSDHVTAQSSIKRKRTDLETSSNAPPTTPEDSASPPPPAPQANDQALPAGLVTIAAFNQSGDANDDEGDGEDEDTIGEEDEDEEEEDLSTGLQALMPSDFDIEEDQDMGQSTISNAPVASDQALPTDASSAPRPTVTVGLRLVYTPVMNQFLWQNRKEITGKPWKQQTLDFNERFGTRHVQKQLQSQLTRIKHKLHPSAYGQNQRGRKTNEYHARMAKELAEGTNNGSLPSAVGQDEDDDRASGNVGAVENANLQAQNAHKDRQIATLNQKLENTVRKQNQQLEDANREIRKLKRKLMEAEDQNLNLEVENAELLKLNEKPAVEDE